MQLQEKLRTLGNTATEPQAAKLMELLATKVREHSSAVKPCGPHVAISPASLRSSNSWSCSPPSTCRTAGTRSTHKRIFWISAAGSTSRLEAALTWVQVRLQTRLAFSRLCSCRCSCCCSSCCSC